VKIGVHYDDVRRYTGAIADANAFVSGYRGPVTNLDPGANFENSVWAGNQVGYGWYRAQAKIGADLDASPVVHPGVSAHQGSSSDAIARAQRAWRREPGPCGLQAS